MSFNIALLVPCTSRKKDYKCFKDTDLYKYLFKSFFSTYDKEHKYTIYLGIDDLDRFYQNINIQDEIKRFVSVMKNTSIFIKTYDKEYEGNPCAIWSDLYKQAILGYNDYFIQVGDDIMFLDKHWINCGIQKLKDNNDLGVVGLADQGRKNYNPSDSLFTQTMVSKKHNDIFGFYFPPELHNWCSDNFIGDIYANHNLKLPIYQRIINCGGEPRYNVQDKFDHIYHKCMEKYGNKIKLYFDLNLDKQFIMN